MKLYKNLSQNIKIQSRKANLRACYRYLTKKDAPFLTHPFDYGDLSGARTQDPLLKREMLYLLS